MRVGAAVGTATNAKPRQFDYRVATSDSYRGIDAVLNQRFRFSIIIIRYRSQPIKE